MRFLVPRNDKKSTTTGIANTNGENASYLSLTNEIDELAHQLYDLTPKKIELVKGSSMTVEFVISTIGRNHITATTIAISTSSK